MHELSIAMSIVEMAQEEAERHGQAQVLAVHLRLGHLSGVAKEALLFSYGVACEGTPLEGSQLIIDEIPVEIFCPNCKVPRRIRSIQLFCCPECFTPATEIVRGREMEIVAMEIKS
jgi:hydrogenase nickel incorporation protein HypA/HybF